MMKCNIEDILRNEHSSLPGMGFINHLKELKTRTEKGDLKALDEFFDRYRFDDNQNETNAFQRTDAATNAQTQMDETNAYSEGD